MSSALPAIISLFDCAESQLPKKINSAMFCLFGVDLNSPFGWYLDAERTDLAVRETDFLEWKFDVFMDRNGFIDSPTRGAWCGVDAMCLGGGDIMLKVFTERTTALPISQLMLRSAFFVLRYYTLRLDSCLLNCFR